MTKKRPLICLIAGEPSGDLLGARLIRALREKTNGEVDFMAIGGESMQAEGVESLFDITDLAIMGLLEVVPSIPKVLNRIKQAVSVIEERAPDIVVSIDSFSFSARVHKRLKERGSTIPRVHYVAPQVWAWKAKRAKTMGSYIDLLLTLLPNEPAYFTPHGLESYHTGHPVIENGADKSNGEAFRKDHNLPLDIPLLTMLPGSRHNEVGRLLPPFKETVLRLKETFPNLQLVVPTVKTVEKTVREELKDFPVPTTIVTGEANRYAAFAASNAALAASGTVAVELAIARLPHIIAYKLSPLTAFLAKRLVKIRFANLLNLLLDKEIIPECLLERCAPDVMAPLLADFLAHPEKGEAQIAELKPGLALLRGGDEPPSLQAATHILNKIAQ